MKEEINHSIKAKWFVIGLGSATFYIAGLLIILRLIGSFNCLS